MHSSLLFFAMLFTATQTVARALPNLDSGCDPSTTTHCSLLPNDTADTYVFNPESEASNLIGITLDNRIAMIINP